VRQQEDTRTLAEGKGMGGGGGATGVNPLSDRGGLLKQKQAQRDGKMDRGQKKGGLARLFGGVGDLKSQRGEAVVRAYI